MPARALEWRAAARADLLSIIDYIADNNETAAQRLKNEIESKIAKLQEHPKRYRPGRVPGTREMLIRPNYIVIYAENPRQVTVLRILHAARQWPKDP